MPLSEAVYAVPKFLLKWKKKPILDHILRSLGDDYTNFFIGMNQRHSDYLPQVRQLLARCDIAKNQVLVMGILTAKQRQWPIALNISGVEKIIHSG